MKNPRDIDQVWSRIVRYEGEVFHQVRGKPFTYGVKGNAVLLHTTNQLIARSQFEQALELVPLENTVPVQHLRGPSYIYAILMDERIRRKDW